MSKLERLIQEHCPNGVNYVAVGELVKSKIIQTITPTFKVKRNDYKESGSTPIISQEAEFISGYCDVVDENILEGKYVCFGDHSEHIKYVDFSFVQGADGLKIMCTDESVLLPRYLYHSASAFYKRHNNYERHFKYFGDTVIPVPPIEVQREIVRILDSFTSLTAELTAELTARKQQYEYYRDQLLNIENLEGVQRVKLSSISDISTGSHNTVDAIENGKYTFFVRSQEPLKIDTFDFNEEAIITAGDGVGVGKVFHYVNGEYSLHQRAYRIHPTSSEVFGKYLFHYFATKFPAYIAKQKFNGSVPSIRRPMLNDFEVLLPNISFQKKIADTLDNFDAICSDLNIGLPAEIEARQKQYEYYRDKLLTFKQLA